jgi:hypothetical protein
MYRRKEMMIALWLIWLSNGTSGAAHIGDFPSYEICRQAANDSIHIGPPAGAPNYSFICIQSK